MVASMNGYTDVVQFLMENGSNPYIVSAADGFTALILALANRYTTTVKLVLANAIGNLGYSALMMVCYEGHTDVVKRLLHYNAEYSQYTLFQGIPFDSFAYACVVISK